MSKENIIIIMLCYVILCIAIFLLVSKYWSKRKNKLMAKQEEKKSILDELEMETNIFEISPAPETELNQFEIDSPYKEKSANEFIDIKEDDIIDDQIDKLMGD
jgi:flagellar basal body-associated protein FliL|tara:strand:- start:45751 stop:46059 length:309 start_codon:yes stop_codon:yes gene_type:complete